MKALLSKSIDELDDLLIKEYTRASKEIYIILMDLYLKISDDGEPLISHLYSYNRYYKISKKINTILNDLGTQEEYLMSEKMEQLFRDTEKQINKQFSLATMVDEVRVKEIIYEDWVGDGSNFSDRVWNNKTAMAKRLRSDLIQAIITGKSPEAFGDNLKHYLVKQGYYPIRRLMRTEMASIQLRGTIEKYKQAGVKQIKLLETNDDRTCDECRERDGTVIDIDKVPSNLLQHPQCRVSITVA